MIKVIGAKRLFLLAVLILVNVLLAASTYLYMIPQESETAKKLRSLRSANQTKQSDIERMQIEFDQLGQQQDKFDALKNDGFFKAQVRSVAKKLFKDIQEESHVVSAVATIKPGAIEENQEAKKSNYKLLVSPVEITIQAFDDSDIYNYLFILEQKFPGHLSVDQMSMYRAIDISGPVLRAIATGANPVLITAKINISWRTMIPESQIIVEEQ
ncbi:MAG: hypothetical protein H6858_03485 [Rhodospirillales bacterium]|nr:hypothetical protein [Alphaproteobacteria bacterium]MCB9976646.1 hypothetical protein [Rhodospirillales bacterium]